MDTNLPPKVSFTKLIVVDAEFVAIGCTDGCVRIFSLLQRKIMRIVNLSRAVHTKSVTCLEVLPTASLNTKRPALLVGAADGTLALWSLDEMRIKDAFDPAPLIKFSSGGSYAGGRAHEEGIELISFNSASTLLSSLDEQNNLAIWDLTKQGE